jgi:hypothetical protein
LGWAMGLALTAGSPKKQIDASRLVEYRCCHPFVDFIAMVLSLLLLLNSIAHLGQRTRTIDNSLTYWYHSLYESSLYKIGPYRNKASKTSVNVGGQVCAPEGYGSSHDRAPS